MKQKWVTVVRYCFPFTSLRGKRRKERKRKKQYTYSDNVQKFNLEDKNVCTLYIACMYKNLIVTIQNRACLISIHYFLIILTHR